MTDHHCKDGWGRGEICLHSVTESYRNTWAHIQPTSYHSHNNGRLVREESYHMISPTTIRWEVFRVTSLTRGHFEKRLGINLHVKSKQIQTYFMACVHASLKTQSTVRYNCTVDIVPSRSQKRPKTWKSNSAIPPSPTLARLTYI